MHFLILTIKDNERRKVEVTVEGINSCTSSINLPHILVQSKDIQPPTNLIVTYVIILFMF